MLIRLLIVLILVGPPGGPRVCTCAVAKASSPPAPVAAAPVLLLVEAKSKSCRCGHHAHRSQPVKNSASVCRPTNDHNPAAPTGHEPNCPTAHPPAPTAVVPSIVSPAVSAGVGASVEVPHAPRTIAPSEFCADDAPVPRVPLFITFLNLRN